MSGNEEIRPNLTVRSHYQRTRAFGALVGSPTLHNFGARFEGRIGRSTF